jgi:hypothetical protein
MDLDGWSKLAVAVLLVAAGALKLWEVRGARVARLAELKTIMEITKELPEESAARSSAVSHVEERLVGFIKDEKTKTRNPVGLILSLFFIGGGVWFVVTAVRDGGWQWWLLAVFLLLFGFVGFGQDGIRRERDATGKALPHDSLRKRTRPHKPE